MRACDYFVNLLSEFPIPLETVGEEGSQVVRPEARAIGACVAGLAMLAVGELRRRKEARHE